MRTATSLGTREEIIMSYEPLVRFWSGKTCAKVPQLEFEDVCQRGFEAVLRAVDSFDPLKKAALNTYVTFCLQNECRTAMAEYFRRSAKNGSLEEVELASCGVEELQDWPCSLSTLGRQIAKTILFEPEVTTRRGRAVVSRLARRCGCSVREVFHGFEEITAILLEV